MNKGVVYIIVGEVKYLKECIFSAKSLKKHCPDIPVTLFTDHTDVKDYCFDKIKIISNDVNPFKNKVKYLWESPYEYTLFIDGDTQIRKPIYELFELLKENDLALANPPLIDRNYVPAKLISYTQENFYNTGVILYKKSAKTEKFFSKWTEKVMLQDDSNMRAGHFCDQYYFNKLIEENYHLDCGLKLTVILNKIYNVRPPMIQPLKKAGEIENVKILHCHNLHRSFWARQYLRLRQRISRDLRGKFNF